MSDSEGWSVDRIAFVDVETTGLDPARSLLLEAAVIVTTHDLVELGRERVVIRHTQEALDASDMNDFVRDMHTSNGLLAEVLADGNNMTLEEADERLAIVLGSRIRPGVPVPMGGCSPWLDRSMIRRDLPRFYSLFHRRTVDASCLKLVFTIWSGLQTHRSESPHRAMPDCEAAVKLARRFMRWIRHANSEVVVPATALEEAVA